MCSCDLREFILAHYLVAEYVSMKQSPEEAFESAKFMIQQIGFEGEPQSRTKLIIAPEKRSPAETFEIANFITHQIGIDGETHSHLNSTSAFPIRRAPLE